MAFEMWLVLAVAAMTGCQSMESDGALADYGKQNLNEPSFPSRRHNSKGIRYMTKGQLGKAETHFRKASESDPTSASAHNNLGTMHLGRRDLYSAAWEFQRASELAPRSIEPLVNLGLVFDEAEQFDQAAEYYTQALTMDPNHAIAIGNLARVRVKQEGDPLEIHNLLKQIVFIDTRPEWVEWAQILLTTKYRFDGVQIFEQAPAMNLEELPKPPVPGAPESSPGDLPSPVPATVLPLSMPATGLDLPSYQDRSTGVSFGSFTGPPSPNIGSQGIVQLAPNEPTFYHPLPQATIPESSTSQWNIPPCKQVAP